MPWRLSVVRFSRTAGAILALCLLAAASAEAAPKKSRSTRSARTPAPNAAQTIPAVPAVSAGAPEWADAWPTNRAASADLQLPAGEDRKAEALAAYAAGLLAEDAADSETALARFRRSFELDPANVDLGVKLAYLLAQRNDAPGGVQVLKDAIKASPKAPLPLIYLAQLYAKHLRKPEQGLKYAEQALALDENNFAAYLAVFTFYSALNQPEKAEALLQKAARSSSTDPQYWLQVGGLFLQSKWSDERGATPAVLEQMNAIFRKAAELGRGDATVQARVGNFFVDTRQLKLSVDYFWATLRMKGDSEDPFLSNVGEKLARVLVETGAPEEAISVLQRVVRENPLRFETYDLLGELQERKGNVDAALEAYKHSLQIDASEPRNHLRVIDMQMRLKRPNDALETARAARAKFPDHPETLSVLAICLAFARQHEEALATYAQALGFFQEHHEDLLTSEFYFRYGAAAEQAGQLERAAQMLRKSIELDPNSAAEAYNYLGYMWVERGQNLDEAGEMIKKALEMQPDNGAYLDSLGWYYFKKGEYDRALTQLLKAVDALEPDDPVVLDHVGDAYRGLGQTTEAVLYWQKALAMDKTNAQLQGKIEAAKPKVSANTATPAPAGAK